MIDSKHTPGIWQKSDNGHDIVSKTEDGRFFYICSYLPAYRPEHNDTEANAELITRAPSLLSDLEQLREENENNKKVVDSLQEYIGHQEDYVNAIKEDRDNFAISFAVWAIHNTQAQAYQAAGITAYDLLGKYKSRPFIDTENTGNQ